MFPDASENARLEALRISLHANQYNVKGWDGTKTVEHYCQFSGGGDIYIAKDNYHQSLFSNLLYLKTRQLLMKMMSHQKDHHNYFECRPH